MKKIKLKPGQVWQVPDKNWIKERVIDFVDNFDVDYIELGNDETILIPKKSFLQWIRRNKAKLIGIKLKTGRVKVVK